MSQETFESDGISAPAPGARPIRIAIVGEYREDFPPLPATDAALHHSALALELELESSWLATDVVERSREQGLERFDGFWIAPGSPYRSLDGALRAIEFARTRSRPLLGTCAGFQHMVLEFARGALGWKGATSEQYSPEAEEPLIHRLACVVRDKELPIRLAAGSRIERLYGASTITERYFCTFGVHPAHRQRLLSAGLRASGTDATNGEIRVIERDEHHFYLGTLFVPQVRSSVESPHPVVTGFLQAAAAYSAAHS